MAKNSTAWSTIKWAGAIGIGAIIGAIATDLYRDHIKPKFGKVNDDRTESNPEPLLQGVNPQLVQSLSPVIPSLSPMPYPFPIPTPSFLPQVVGNPYASTHEPPPKRIRVRKRYVVANEDDDDTDDDDTDDIIAYYENLDS